MVSYFSRAIAFIGLILIGFWGGLAPLMDSWWGIFPAIFFFFCFVSALLGWGWFWEKRIGGGAPIAYLFSSLSAVGFAMIMGHLGLLGNSYRWFFLLFLMLGLFVGPGGYERKSVLWFNNRWWNFLFIFIFGLRFFSAYLPHGHGDPLLYHLMAPRLWNLSGAVQLNVDLPIPLLASTWEYFYLWPQVLFASSSAGIGELIVAQIFSQWIHLLWGLYGSLIVLKGILAKRVNLNESDANLLAISFLFVASMQWTAGLAKNDCGVAFWCIGAWLFFEKRNLQSWLWAGVFAGLAVAGKINAILFLIPLGIFVLFQEGVTQKWKGTFPLALAGILGFIFGAGPIYLRNWVETANPFYTMFYHWFPSPWISQSWADHFSAHQPSDHNIFEMLHYRIRQLTKESPVYWLWLFFPVAIVSTQVRARFYLLKEWFVLFFLSVGICVLALSTAAEVRYLGPSLWLGAILASYIYLGIVDRFFPRGKTIASFILLAGILASSKLPTHLLWKFPGIRPGSAMVLEHTAGRAKAWLRANAGKRLVVINGDNETYYLSTLRTTVLTERPDIDRATYGKRNIEDFVAGLCSASGASLLLDARANAALQARFPHPAWDYAVLFEADNARVYDLKKLQNLVLKKNAGCGKDS